MLVLAGTEFVFFIVGGVGLCFVLGLEMLTMQDYFVAAVSVKAFSASHTITPPRGWRCTRSYEGTV